MLIFGFFLESSLQRKFSELQKLHRQWFLDYKQNFLNRNERKSFEWRYEMKFLEKYVTDFERRRIVIPHSSFNIESHHRKKSNKWLKLVEKYPVLYDENHPHHRNRNLIQIVWLNIASKLRTTGMFFFCKFFILIDLDFHLIFLFRS